MSMGRKTSSQPPLWVPHTAVSTGPRHTFYEKLNELLEKHRFDTHVEGLCQEFYAPDDRQGRRSIPPGVYFRMLLIGYFEGIESERGICWRCADSLSLRGFLGLEVTDPVPDHSSLSRIRGRLAEGVYDEVFRLVLSIVEREGLLKGRVVGVDSTYLRADASMKAIVRRETGESYAEYLKTLARAQGIENPTDEDARRMDRKRKKKTPNAEWRSSTDPEAKIARLKDGRTRLAYKPEHVVDLDTGAILAAEVHPANVGDTQTIGETLEAARTNVSAAVDTRRFPTETTMTGRPRVDLQRAERRLRVAVSSRSSRTRATIVRACCWNWRRRASGHTSPSRSGQSDVAGRAMVGSLRRAPCTGIGSAAVERRVRRSIVVEVIWWIGPLHSSVRQVALAGLVCAVERTWRSDTRSKSLRRIWASSYGASWASARLGNCGTRCAGRRWPRGASSALG